MLPLTATRNNQEQGFNLLEITIVLFMIGILAAISAPSLLGWYRRTQLENAVTNVQGALQQAQREAIRSSTTCNVTINSSSINSDCSSNRIVPDFITLEKKPSNDITFGFRGNVNDEHIITFDIETVAEQRCLAIAAPLGMVREGIYRSGECEKP